MGINKKKWGVFILFIGILSAISCTQCKNCEYTKVAGGEVEKVKKCARKEHLEAFEISLKAEYPTNFKCSTSN